MKNQIFIILLLSGLSIQLSAQSISIQPYLQDADPHTMHILWETTTADESIVEWGLTDTLGNQTTGISYTSNGDFMVHEVRIENLEPFTKYYYRVKTGNVESEIFNFKTPPHSEDHDHFRIVAMSDMQRDGAFPNKFREMVEDGVLTYLEEEYGGDLIDNLALVMIPGDLVVNGNNFDSWKTTFFQPAEKLFSHVPVYPVLGNHENNSQYYFTYFKMPENGTPGYEEHWWHKDYGNVRMIGLNSNGPFNNPEQLSWLDSTLTSTCAADSIDFVFAQLHHPHKSELWTPGESNFTGEVIERLEQFSTDCGKPSIHFFGHTHGYSRGQSRDHKHLWINVATAGGAIDNWGEFPNFDYDEFSVSQDEYGFVMVEITDDSDPKLVIKRISRGDQDTTINNALTDSLTIRLAPSVVNQPEPLFPVDLTGIAPECVILKGNPFSAPNPEATHGQSHWQLSTQPQGFDNPDVERWKNFENWYFDIDTQAGDDLTDESIQGLEEFTTYYWRVRYRDKELNWSEWSDPASFTTGESIALPNLLLNPGAEDSTDNWSVLEGVFESLESEVCNGIMPYSGERYFSVGGLCDHSPVARVVQNINVAAYTDSIDAGGFKVNFGGYLSNYSGADLPEMKLTFLDQNLAELGQSNTLSTTNSNWTLLSESMDIPAQTRNIQLELKGTRNAGTDNDSYFDALFVSIGTLTQNCDSLTSSVQSRPVAARPLTIFPNPAHDLVTIEIPELLDGDFILGMTNSSGNKVSPPFTIKDRQLTIQLEGLPNGTYFVWLWSKQGVQYTGKVVVAN